jgi:predicted RNA-binding protein with RPS1 domain
VREDDELWGEVTKVSNYGAFIDVGVEVQGFLHIIYYPKRGSVRD